MSGKSKIWINKVKTFTFYFLFFEHGFLIYYEDFVHQILTKG